MLDNRAHKVLIVDDEQFVCELLTSLLEREGYEVYQTNHGADALKLLGNMTFSLMISDINMPGISGIDLLGIAHERFKDLAVIMVTAVDDYKVALRCLELGAYGYIIKPFDINEVIINVTNALRIRALEIENRAHRDKLEKIVQMRTEELRKAEQEVSLSREETIHRLAKAAEFRDDETAQHTTRMSYYCEILAQKANLPPEQCELIRIASPLHDVGKIGIPDNILLKRGKLTTEEMDIMKRHTEIGFRILTNSKSAFLEVASIIALTHHEKFNGQGYPKGLSGNQIPIEGRIASICDVFDALTSDRVYKSAFSVEKTIDIIFEGKGSHFDPDLLDLFLGMLDEILAIKRRFIDGAPTIDNLEPLYYRQRAVAC